ncbi:hypothetical protein Taro_045617 [Colocasia esculenta]|uniref:Uncharacterized protein n=1 Tax=Colocasia esculenta TaxID=4460 RepID=A0A843X0L2_COLES|nr:hypothetical protein [Colocasia esculenta]
MSRPIAFWGLEAKSLDRFPLFPFFPFFPSLLLSEEESFPLRRSDVSRVVPCVPVLADGPSGGCSRKGCRACLCQLGLSLLRASGVVSVVVATLVFSFARCSALEGLSVRQVVTVTWDPYPHAPVLEGVAPGGRRAQVSDLKQKGKTASDCCFDNPSLGAIHGGTGGRAYGETLLLTWLFGVSRGDTWLFLPDLVEVWDVGACVMRLWSLVVAPVFLSSACVDSDSSVGVVFGLTRVVVETFTLFSLLCLRIRGWRCDLRRSLAGVREVGSLHYS